MKDNTYAILCSVLTGIANLFVWTGYDSHVFIVESVLHSVHGRDNDRVGPHDGYYGLAVMNAFYMVSNLIAPSFSNYLRSKWILAISTVLYLCYYLTFQVLNRYLYFTGCAFLGCAFAFFNNGYSGYLTEISTRKNLERNQALSWGVSCMSVFCAGVIYIIVTSMSITDTAQIKYREYSDSEIRLFFTAFAILVTVGLVLFLLHPNRDVDNSIASGRTNVLSVKEQMGSMFTVLTHRRTMILLPFYLYIGIYFSFWISVMPTTIQFTKSLAHHIYLPAYFGMVLTAGSVLMSIATIFLSRRIKNFGMRPLLIFNLFIHFATFIVVTASVPAWSTVMPNDEPALLFQPSPHSILLIAFLFGIGDAANNTSRTVITSLILPKFKSQTFATSRLFHAMSASILFFVSPYLSVHMYVVLMVIFLVMGTVSYWFASGIVIKDEKQEEETIREVPTQLSIWMNSMILNSNGQKDDDALERPAFRAPIRPMDSFDLHMKDLQEKRYL